VTIYFRIYTKSAFFFFFFSPVCFKVFDIDRDGVLSEEELQHMVDVLLFVCHENKSPEELASDPYGQAGE
jgi:hypothetical protein